MLNPLIFQIDDRTNRSISIQHALLSGARHRPAVSWMPHCEKNTNALVNCLKPANGKALRACGGMADLGLILAEFFPTVRRKLLQLVLAEHQRDHFDTTRIIAYARAHTGWVQARLLATRRPGYVRLAMSCALMQISTDREDCCLGKLALYWAAALLIRIKFPEDARANYVPFVGRPLMHRAPVVTAADTAIPKTQALEGSYYYTVTKLTRQERLADCMARLIKKRLRAWCRDRQRHNFQRFDAAPKAREGREQNKNAEKLWPFPEKLATELQPVGRGISNFDRAVGMNILCVGAGHVGAVIRRHLAESSDIYCHSTRWVAKKALLAGLVARGARDSRDDLCRPPSDLSLSQHECHHPRGAGHHPWLPCGVGHRSTRSSLCCRSTLRDGRIRG